MESGQRLVCSMSVIHSFHLSVTARTVMKQIRPWDTLACYWDVEQASKQASNNLTVTSFSSSSWFTGVFRNSCCGSWDENNGVEGRRTLNTGATRGVTVSMSAFLACHQCAGSSLAWGLNLRAVVCGIFWSSSPGVFSGYSGFLPSFIGLMVRPIK